MRDLVLHGDVYSALDSIDAPIATAVTSPPYWKQRDYGFEDQIGQEATPEAYIGRLVTVYRKLREKLRDDGIFFLNVGDKYESRYGKSHLLQIPYRLAYHMVKDGWLLEDNIIWYKPNHMPSSVKDRFSNTYEPIIVLAKSAKNIYKKDLGNVIKVPLQQTPWKHTAAFPEKLIEELLDRVRLKDDDVIVDPFGGTGTVADVVNKKRNQLFAKRLSSIMIEKGDDFVEIIKARAGITEVKRIADKRYDWAPVVEEGLPEVAPKVVARQKSGEVYIADTSKQFISALKGITTDEFKRRHREDALYFFGVKRWTLEDLYAISCIYKPGYVLRNMMVISGGKGWYPIFMFARDSTVVTYKFYLDRIRTDAKTKESRDWRKEDFVGLTVTEATKDDSQAGQVVKVLEKYDDGFPKAVVVQWNGHASVEVILHPQKNEMLMEGLTYRCPACSTELEQPFDPVEKNCCSACGRELWSDMGGLPRIEEPSETLTLFESFNASLPPGELVQIEALKRNKSTKSKFTELDRINWGASPGARKLMVGDYFTKMRLYRVDQPSVAQILSVLRKNKGLSLDDIAEKSPKSYRHTVGHWFRKDFGGSLPVPEDIPLLKGILRDHPLFDMLGKKVLKFQTVMASQKGKNPGDFHEFTDNSAVSDYLEALYLPSQQYRNNPSQ